MKVTTRPIHKIAVIVPVDYRFEDDQGSLATEQGKATREASPPPEAARIQELPRSISWADEMEEEYELNGPPPDLDPGEVLGQCQITTTRLGKRTRVGEDSRG